MEEGARERREGGREEEGRQKEEGREVRRREKRRRKGRRRVGRRHVITTVNIVAIVSSVQYNPLVMHTSLLSAY